MNGTFSTNAEGKFWIKVKKIKSIILGIKGVSGDYSAYLPIEGGYLRVYDSGLFNSLNLIGSNKISISFWVKRIQLKVDLSFMGFSASSNFFRGLSSHTPYSVNNNVYFDYSYNVGGTNRIQGPSGFSNWTGTWHHLAFTKNGVNTKIWLDGVSIASSSSAPALYTDFSKFFIGSGFLIFKF